MVQARRVLEIVGIASGIGLLGGSLQFFVRRYFPFPWHETVVLFVWICVTVAVTMIYCKRVRL
jgi:hypothetical protein